MILSSFQIGIDQVVEEFVLLSLDRPSNIPNAIPVSRNEHTVADYGSIDDRLLIIDW